MQGVDATVDADRFMAAVDACDGEPDDVFVEEGLLVVKKKRYKAKMKMMDATQFPRQGYDSGMAVRVRGGEAFLDVLRRLRPFVSDDASRPWSMGVLFQGGYAYATNNVLVARAPTGFDIEARRTVVPVFAIDELLRIGVGPLEVTRTSTALFFTFTTWWLRSHLIETEWPDVAALFTGWKRKLPSVPNGLRDDLRRVAEFIPDKKYPVIKFSPDGIATLEGDYFAEVTDYRLPNAQFRVEPLKLLLDNATHCDFSLYPQRCPWFGNDLEGFIVGVRA
jgi:DNA polymerase III sliding clamp (beta) subunit (PCNA family)